MEDEKIIITNEENSYDAVIVENTDEIIYDETIQIIELDEPELYNVGTDEAFTSLGGQNEQLNHALMHNRDLPDQHTIRSITGLREELDGIHALKTVESDKRGCANYYMWKDEQSSLPSDRVGYFVSIHTRDHKVSICDADTEIFGVTVGSAGFVGWQHYDEENKPRDEEYILVANTGVVKVRCWPSVVAGDYVMSANDGRARKTNNGFGYYVISIDDSDGTRHAVISLDSTMNQVYDLSQEVDTFNERMDNVEIRTNSAINSATEALKQGFESSINSALQNSQNALDNANSALDKIEGLENGSITIPGVTEIQQQVDAIEDRIMTETKNAAQIVVDDLTKDATKTSEEVEKLKNEVGIAQKTADDSLDAVRGLFDEIIPLVEFNDGEHKGAAGIVTSAENNILQLAAISQCLSSNYDIKETWHPDLTTQTDKIFYVKDEEVYYYYDVNTGDWLKTKEPTEAGLFETIASIRQKTDKNEAMVEGLTSYTGKDYTIIPEWNGYERVDVWSQDTSDPNIIYKDNAGFYHWCDISDLENSWKSDTTPPRDDLEEKDTEQKYYAEDTGLFYYYDNGWHANSSLSVTSLIEAIALTKQLANKNGAQIEQILKYEGPDSATLAGIDAKVEENKASINSLTSYVKNDYKKLDDPWDVTNKDTDVIYYAQDPNNTDGNGEYIWKYWYWKTDVREPYWASSVDPADAGLAASLANINQTVTDQGAKITAFTEWQGETNDAITKLQQSSGEDGASMESLVMNISKYSVGKYSQAYGLTVEEAQELLRDGTVFVPSENTVEYYGNYITLDDIWSTEEESIRDKESIYYAQASKEVWKFWSWNASTSKWVSADLVDTIKKRLFSKNYYYVWDKASGTWNAFTGVNFVVAYEIGGSTQYIVIEDNYTSSVTNIPSKTDTIGVSGTMYYAEDERVYYYYYNDTWYIGQDPNFEIGALYYWNTKGTRYWQKVATIESNTLNRAIAQMRQSVTDTAAEFSTELTNTKGDLVAEIGKVDNKFSSYVTTTTFNENITEIKQETTDNTATLSMLAMSGVEFVEVWDSEKPPEDTTQVYYDKTNKKYYYYDGGWLSTKDVNYEKVAEKIKSAGIITAINGDTSEVKISGDKVSIAADQIDLSGFVTISGNKYDNFETVLTQLDNMSNSSITKVDILYKAVASNETPSKEDEDWATTISGWEEDDLIWTLTQTTSGGETSRTDPVCITSATGSTGPAGPAGVGISKIEELYYLHTSDTTVPPDNFVGWTEAIQPVDSTSKYLWNYEKITYANGHTQLSDPVIIYTYGNDGKSILKIGELYATSTAYMDIPRNTSIYIPQFDSENKYLWNKEIVYFTDGTMWSSDLKMFGIYDDTGASGTGLSGITNYYFATNESSGVSNKTSAWSTTQPTWEKDMYIWTRNKIVWDDGNIAYTDPVLAKAINSANESADLALNRVTKSYGVCNTDENDANKTVTLKDFELYEGATISVSFKYANKAHYPKLKVGNTEAKYIYAVNAPLANELVDVDGEEVMAYSPYNWRANETVQFTYDGENWVMSNVTSVGALAALCQDNNITMIDGSKIATGSVTAVQLAAGAITADKITAGTLKSKNYINGPIISTEAAFSVTGYRSFEQKTYEGTSRYYYTSKYGTLNSMAVCQFWFNVEKEADIKIDIRNSGSGKDLAYFSELDSSEDISTLFTDGDFTTLAAGQSSILTFNNVSIGLHYVYIGFYQTTSYGQLSFSLTEDMVDRDGSGFGINLDNGTIDSPNFKVSADGSLTLNGYLTVNDVGATGSTQICGSRIRTGQIQGNNYSLNTSTGFAIQGMEIDLTKNTLTGKNFKMDTSGNLVVNGMITSTDLATKGKTTINGSNIKTGVIESFGYTYNIKGTQIDLANGAIYSKNFKIDSSGDVDVKGKFSTYYGSLTGMEIDGYSIHWKDSSYDTTSGLVDSAISAMTVEGIASAGLAVAGRLIGFGYRFVKYDAEEYVPSIYLSHHFGNDNVNVPNYVALYPLFLGRNDEGEQQEGEPISRLGTKDYPWTQIYGDIGVFNWSLKVGGQPVQTAGSSEKYKKNIIKYDKNALDLINDSVIYSYQYKKDGDDALTKYGLVIERECPTEIVDDTGESIYLYSMTSLAWKAIQELSDKVTELEEKLNERNS
jgi:hypothetical protein